MQEPEFEFDAGAVSGDHHRVELTLEQLSAAIAESQAALLAGRLRDLETCTRKQQELRQRFELLSRQIAAGSESSDQDDGRALRPAVLDSARRVYFQNLIFAGVLRRMRLNLEARQRQAQGAASSYSGGRERSWSGAVPPGHFAGSSV